MSQPGYVYRAFDAEGALLYVGVTINPGSRLGSHASQAAWWGEVKCVDVQQFASRDDAQAAENAAILAENPRHNIAGARTVDPEELERRREARRKRDEELRRRWDAAWLPDGAVVCGNCTFKPHSLPKGQLVTETECPRCGCSALERDVA